jgi:hypothetical protein
MVGVLTLKNVVACILHCLDARCLNNLGLQAINDHSSLKCFENFFTSKTYLCDLAGDKVILPGPYHFPWMN